jgi:hypothetical protein
MTQRTRRQAADDILYSKIYSTRRYTLLEDILYSKIYSTRRQAVDDILYSKIYSTRRQAADDILYSKIYFFVLLETTRAIVLVYKGTTSTTII